MTPHLPLPLACLLVLSLAAPLAAQDWRYSDPTDPTDDPQPSRYNRRQTSGDNYGDLRYGDGSTSTGNPQERGDYTRSDVWQVADRSSTGSFPLFQGEQRGGKQLPETKRPWSSTYWPFQDCALAFKTFGSEGLSPMELYDTYVNATKGRNPGAAAWEGSSVAQTLVVGGGQDFGRPNLVWRWKLGHNMAPWMVDREQGLARVPYTNADGERGWQSIQVDWWGHCNGWSAAAILVPEPPEQLVVRLDKPLTKLRLKEHNANWPEKDSSLGQEAYDERRTNQRTLTFTGADLKGLYTEAYLSTAAKLQNPNNPRFYRPEDAGRRYDPASGRSEQQLAEDYRDILPHNFHRIMLDHLEREKGIVAEKDANEHVNNLPVVGWSYVHTYNRGRQAYDVQARVYYANYASPTYRGTKPLAIDYTYRIFLDNRNRVVNSQWLGKSVDSHPDFIWVPDQPVPVPLKRNPAIKLEILDELVKSAQRG